MTNLKKRLSTLLLVLSTPMAISNINGVSAGVPAVSNWQKEGWLPAQKPLYRNHV